MRTRKSSRLIVLDKNNRVLLFHFIHKQGALKKHACWATPGGEVEKNETLQQAAKRELYEETGFNINTIGNPISHSKFKLLLPDGENVIAEEYYFVVHAPSNQGLSTANWTKQEHEVIANHKWWSIEELKTKPIDEIIYPENLIKLLEIV